MEGKPKRGRGGSWKRGGGGGGGGNEAESSGEHRGRGRGGYRGRGKRSHYRGRGGPQAASAIHRDLEQHDDSRDLEEEEIEELFSRRKLESNWDRYEESDKEALNEDDMPTQRGTDFHILLESAGDSYSQFRFAEEKEWEMDALAVSQIASMFLDLPALVQSLQDLPLHQRLNLDADLVQVSTPVELPSMSLGPRQDLGASGPLKSQSPAPKGLGTSLGLSSAISPVSSNVSQGSSNTVKPLEEDIDEELDRLLSLQTPVSKPSEAAPFKEELKTSQDQPTLQKEEEPIPEGWSASSKVEPVKQEVTEEDLEDWLDSMIS